MLDTQELTELNIQEIRDLADQVAQLPSLEVPEVSIFENLIGEEFWRERFRWFSIGVHMWTTISNISDPIQNSNLDENLKEQIRVDSNYYLALAQLIFQSEAFIKTEVRRQEIEYPFSDGLELIYTVIAEECIDRLRTRVPQNEWVSPSGSELKDMARDSKKWLNEGIKDELFLKKLNKWIEKDKNNLNSCIFMPKPAYLGKVRWGDLCNRTFYKHRKQLPGFWNYTLAKLDRVFVRLPFAKKIAFIGGQVRPYPGRGKSSQNEG